MFHFTCEATKVQSLFFVFCISNLFFLYYKSSYLFASYNKAQNTNEFLSSLSLLFLLLFSLLFLTLFRNGDVAWAFLNLWQFYCSLLVSFLTNHGKCSSDFHFSAASLSNFPLPYWSRSVQKRFLNILLFKKRKIHSLKEIKNI